MLLFMIEWKIEKRKISDLKEYSKNPRKLSKHDASHLRKSLQKFGIIDKPIINTDNTIIGGHQRVAILKKIGIKIIDVYVPYEPLSDEDVLELNLRLNRNMGEWDIDILGNEFGISDLLECGFLEQEFGVNADDIISIESDEPVKKKGKPKICPQCGHEF